MFDWNPQQKSTFRLSITIHTRPKKLVVSKINNLHLHPLTGTVVGVPFSHGPRQRCLSSAVRSRVGRSQCVHSYMLSSQLFLWRPRLLLPSRGPCWMGCFCNGVVSSDVAEPGELALQTRALAFQQWKTNM